jgi:betaine lipid synthase
MIGLECVSKLACAGSCGIDADSRPLKADLQPLTDFHPHSLGWTLALTSSVLFTLALGPYLSTPLRFIWNCFLKPLGKAHDNQSQVLDAFYAGQADVYDTTRTHLLKGREDMLQLLASHLKAQPQGISGAGGAAVKPKIWVDIGGGTGWNIEKM